VDRVDAEQVEADARAADVHDGVHRAHVVEVHALRGGAVHPGLRLGQALEDARGHVPHRRGQAASLENVEDLPEAPMDRLVVAERHVHLGGAKARLDDLAALEPVAGHAQPGQLARERLEWRARVHQRAQDHVARGAARAIEVG
jgi:hypothetical protein